MNDTRNQRIEDTEEAWEVDGPLGNEEQFAVKATDNVHAQVDASLGLVPISIRLQKDLLDNLKALAQLNGIGYQPLIRQVLTRFVDCELKSILRDQAIRKGVAPEVSEIAADVSGTGSMEGPAAPHREAA